MAEKEGICPIESNIKSTAGGGIDVSADDWNDQDDDFGDENDAIFEDDDGDGLDDDSWGSVHSDKILSNQHWQKKKQINQ